MNVKLAALAALALFALSSPAFAQSLQTSALLYEARQAINLGNTNYCRAWLTANANLMSLQFAPDGASLEQGGKEFKGRTAIKKRFAELMSAGPAKRATIKTEDEWVVGKTAYETGTYSFVFGSMKPGAREEVVAGHYVTVWQRQPAGGWKIIADIGVPAN